MLLRNGTEDTVPVWTTEVGGRTQRGDRILLRTDVLDNDIVHVIFLDLGSQINVDLDAVLGVLLLDSVQQRVEPLRTAEVTDDPGKVDLGQARRLRVVEVVQAVPNRLQDSARTIISDVKIGQMNLYAHEANGVTPIPAPTRRTVS